MNSLALSRLANRLTLGRIKLGWWSSPWRSDQSPICAGGASRSGTTLLYTLMGAHSRIYFALETALLTGKHDLDYLSFRLEMPVSRIEPIYRRSSCAPEFMQELLSSQMREKGKVRWGDKTPRNVLHLEEYFRWFPKGRFIHMIRDGRDVVCSLRTHKPALINKPGPEPVQNPWPECVKIWANWTRAALSWRGDPRYYELRYEELVSDPENTLAKLLQWLGEPWEPAILAKSQKTKVITHPGVSKPIHREAMQRWRHDLPEEARQAFEPEGNQLLVDLGYAENAAWMRETVLVG